MEEHTDSLKLIMKRFVEASKKGSFEELKLGDMVLSAEEIQLVSMLNEGLGNYRMATMTETERVIDEHENLIQDINHRDELLQAVNQSATILLQTEPEQFEYALNQSMSIIGKVVSADRVYIWKNHMKDGELCSTQIYEWSEGVESQQNNEYTVDIPYSEGMPEMLEFAKGKSINGPVKNMSEASCEHLSSQGIKSVLIVPIFLEDQFWGFMGFDDCHNERIFTEKEEAILRSGSLLFANALLRNETIQNLQEVSGQLNERLTQQQIVSDISKSFMTTKEPMDNLIQSALAQMGSFINADRVIIAVFEKKSEISRPAYFWFNDSKYAPNSSQKGFSSIIRELFPQFHDDNEDNPSIYCNNTLTYKDEKFKIFNEKGGLKSFVGVPIYIEGELWGIMSVENHEMFREWSENDVMLISTVSSAISNAVIRDIMEKERTDALDKAVYASKAKSDFLSNMSHEIRTPMNAVIGMTTIGKKAESIEAKNQALNKIGDASTHLLNVINDILDMAKIEANKLELSPVNFEFRKTLQKTIDIIGLRAKELGQQLNVNIDDNIPPSLIGDEHRLTQVITNLLSNAVKFTPEEGEINVDAKLLSETNDLCRLQISVSDTGIGISEEQKERLFNSFEQAESGTSRKYGGTGLGLAICKSIVEMMGGKIWVESVPEKGSTFHFTVALENGHEINFDENTLEENGSNVDRNNFAGYMALIAEDIDINREIVEAILDETNLGIEFAENGVEAVDKFIANPDKYDMIFMDLQMPEMDGFEATRNIRDLAIPQAKTIPIIAMTANVFREDIENCLNAGMNGHIGKPINYEDILKLLRQYLKETKETIPDAVSELGEAAEKKTVQVLISEEPVVPVEIPMTPKAITENPTSTLKSKLPWWDLSNWGIGTGQLNGTRLTGQRQNIIVDAGDVIKDEREL